MVCIYYNRCYGNNSHNTQLTLRLRPPSCPKASWNSFCSSEPLHPPDGSSSHTSRGSQLGGGFPPFIVFPRHELSFWLASIIIQLRARLNVRSLIG